MASRLFVSALAVVTVALAFAAPACSDEGEGEPCSRYDDDNGNDDCQEGYQCYQASELNGPPQTDICCPGDRAYATTAVCALTTATVGDADVPTETGSTTPSTDSGSDSAVANDASGSDSATPDTGASTPDTGSSTPDTGTDSPTDG